MPYYACVSACDRAPMERDIPARSEPDYERIAKNLAKLAEELQAVKISL